MTVPWLWHSSVILRKWGITASSAMKFPRVRTAVGCGGVGSITIIPAPPRARSR